MFRGFLPLNSVICNFAKCVLKNLLCVRTEEVSEEVFIQISIYYIFMLFILLLWCPVLPAPAPAGRAGAGSSPAVKVRRSRWRWPAGPAADSGRWPESRLSGDRAANDRAAGSVDSEDCFFSFCVLGAECNTLQLYSYFCLQISFDGYSQYLHLGH